MLADEVMATAKHSSREEKSFKDQLRQIDTHASAFRALIGRFKLESILEYYIQGGAEESKHGELISSLKIDQTSHFRNKSADLKTGQEAAGSESESESGDSMKSSELHLDLDSIIKPGSIVSGQWFNQASGIEDEISIELKSDLQGITSKLNALISKLNNRTLLNHKQREEKSLGLNFSGLQGQKKASPRNLEVSQSLHQSNAN